MLSRSPSLGILAGKSNQQDDRIMVAQKRRMSAQPLPKNFTQPAKVMLNRNKRVEDRLKEMYGPVGQPRGFLAKIAREKAADSTEQISRNLSLALQEQN